MKTAAYNVEEITIPPSIPDGIYDGIWGGYEIVFYACGKTFKAKTEEGVRGFGIKCAVSVCNGKITVSI